MSNRPDRIHYYLGQAISVASRAECKGYHVGAVLVGAGNRVLSTGYNGAPEGFGNCSEGRVCPRCDHSELYGGSGNGYDKCICVHAEMNAITAAARYGMAIDGASAYVTHQPCLTCSKELIQAGVCRLYYLIDLPTPPIAFGENGASASARDACKDYEAEYELERTKNRLLGQLQGVQVNFLEVVKKLEEAIVRFEEDRRRAQQLTTQPRVRVGSQAGSFHFEGR